MARWIFILWCGLLPFIAKAEVGTIAAKNLPAQARQVLQTIKQGGPYQYSRDGVVFGNYERRLPKQARGFYHEYTVPTPGVSHRGARRIVSGGQPPMVFYYTADHYGSFQRIQE